MSSRPSRSASLKRHNRQKAPKVPSSSYYLGYVEDDETIEMIMKKFEELEKIKQNHHASSSSCSQNHHDDSSCYLNEEQQEELFKRTSHHSIQSNIYAEIMRNFDTTLGISEEEELEESDHSSDDEDYQEDEEDAFDECISDDDNYEEEEELDHDFEEENAELPLDSMNHDRFHSEEEFLSMTEEEEDSNNESNEKTKRTKKKRKTSQRKSNRKSHHQDSTTCASHAMRDISMLLDPNMNFLKMMESSHKSTNLGTPKKKKSTEIVTIPTSNKILSAWAKMIRPITLEECDLCKISPTSTIISSKISSKMIVKRNDHQDNHQHDACHQSLGMVYHIQTTEEVIITHDLLNFNFQEISNQKGPFEGILIDPPYDSIQVEDLKKLPLDKEWFISKGYCFIWVEKEFTVQIIKIMKEFNFDYVDSMCWVREQLNQSFSTAPSLLFPKSKLSLFIFRKKNNLTKSMHLKHQRNADVVFDFEKENPRERPSIVFHVIETLLFSSNSFLELWGEGCYKHCKQKTPSKWTIIKEIS